MSRLVYIQSPTTGADPGLSVSRGAEAKIGKKGDNFARFWPIIEGRHPHAPLLDLPLHYVPILQTAPRYLGPTSVCQSMAGLFWLSINKNEFSAN